MPEERCDKCFKVIVDDFLSFKGSNYHTECFTCSHCQLTLDGKKFAVQESGRMLCATCLQNASFTCNICDEPIIGGKYVEYRTSHYHEDCFLCAKCRNQIGQGKFTVTANGFYCALCKKV
ncbi:four and a half LIM domains protein 2-like [Convolutriloba macropyga]|uniref:four and a half LIM domains protein 2-like n=1 Tax=Convolutriloba macropyga TaxID=536237 RepID=UPI003F525F36